MYLPVCLETMQGRLVKELSFKTTVNRNKSTMKHSFVHTVSIFVCQCSNFFVMHTATRQSYLCNEINAFHTVYDGQLLSMPPSSQSKHTTDLITDLTMTVKTRKQ